MTPLVTMPVHSLVGCGPFGVLPDDVCNFFGSLVNFMQQSLELLQNPFKWLYHHTLGAPIPQGPGDPGWAACQADWTQPSCPKLVDELTPSKLSFADTWPQLYGALSVSGVFIAATCCMVRLIRGVFDERVAGVHLVVDNVVRLVVATGVLVVPSPDNSLLLHSLELATGASAKLAEAAGGTVIAAFSRHLDLNEVVGNIATTGFGLAAVGEFLVAIPILLAGLAFLYMLALYLLRVVQLVFAVATAPLFVGLAVYDHRNRFFQWWTDLLASVLLLPLILAVCGALTAGVAVFFLNGNQSQLSPGGAVEAVTRTLLACFAVLGGVWMTGKAVHGLAWRSFTHGGITGALTAISTTAMALPIAANDVGAVLRASGHRPRPGGVIESLGRAAQYRLGAGGRTDLVGRDAESLVGGAAAGHAAAMAADGPEVRAGIAASQRADYSVHPAASGVLAQPSMRDAFNRAVGGAVGQFAMSDEGRATVVSATRHLDSGGSVSLADRVGEYSRMVAADAHLGAAVSGAALASLMHNQPPDLSPILDGRVPARP